MNSYGKELILDLVNCNPEKFNRKDFRNFYDQLCDILGVEKGPVHFWDYNGFWYNAYCWLFERESLKKNAPPHLKGTSAVQFIMTSSLVIHALDDLKTLYINVFSCDDFRNIIVSNFIRDYFEGKIVANHNLLRGEY